MKQEKRNSLLFLLVLGLSLPGLRNIRSSSPPIPEGEQYILRQELPGLTIGQAESWIGPLEKEILSLPETDSVESTLRPGMAIVTAERKAGFEGGTYPGKLTRITEKCGAYLPVKTGISRFSSGNQNTLPCFVLLFEDEEEAEAIRARLASLRGIGSISLSFREGRVLVEVPREPVPDYPYLSLVSSLRESERYETERYRIEQRTPGDAVTDTTTARFNGRPVTVMTVEKGEKDILELHGSIHKILSLSEKEGKNFTVLYDSAAEQIRETKHILISIMAGFLLVGFLLFIRHREFRVSLALLGIIPASLIPALGISAYLGIPINLLTLSAYACCTGTVADAAVLILEENRGTEKGGKEAAIIGTITTIAAFIPLPFLPPRLSSLLAGYALVICTALGASLFYALTILPLLLPPLAQKKQRAKEAAVPFFSGRGFLIISLMVMLIAAPLIMLTTARPLLFSYYGSAETDRVQFRVEFPERYPQRRIRERIADIEKTAAPMPEVLDTLVIPGESHLDVTLFTGKGEDLTAFRKKLRNQLDVIPGYIRFSRSQNSESGFSISIYGEDPELRNMFMEELLSFIRVSGSDAQLLVLKSEPEEIMDFQLVPHGLFLHRISPSHLAAELSWMIGGGIIIRGKGKDKGAVTVKPKRLEEISDVLIPYRTFGSIGYRKEVLSMYRRNGIPASRLFWIPSGKSDREAAELLSEIKEWISEKKPLPDTGLELAPEIKKRNDLLFQASLGASASGIAILLTLMIRYGKLFTSLLLLLPVISALFWSLAVLMLSGVALTIPGIGALLFAAGISVNNGVLLLPPAGKPPGQRERIPAASLLLPLLSTWAGTAPLAVGAVTRLKDVPLIMAVATCAGSITALIVHQLHARSCRIGHAGIRKARAE
jgi:multidrug efflux pump subunit AcrB